jgi:iron complex transport system substrate-binding protein
MKRLVLMLALVVAASVGSAAAVEIDTAQGRVDVAAKPERIAVFDIAAIDTLDRLGVAIAGVPDNLYLPELKHLSESAEVVGTLFEPNLEALSALAPDLVIVGGRSSTQLEAASRVAPSIDMTLYGINLIEVARERIAAYGRLFEREQAATAAAGDLDDAIARAREAVAGKGRALIVMTNGPKVSAYGAQSRFGWLHRELDLPSAMDQSEGAEHGEAVSFEFIREADPDWLIVLDRSAAIGAGDANARATLDNELVAATTAWRKQQVVYMPAADFYIAAGGVSATIRVLDVLTRGFSGR